MQTNGRGLGLLNKTGAHRLFDIGPQSIPRIALGKMSCERHSATYTLAGGHRGFGMLHVAAATELKARQFLTFDANQKRLAESEGLIVPV